MRKCMPPWVLLVFVLAFAVASPQRAPSDPLDLLIAAPQAIKMYYGYEGIAGVISSVIQNVLFPTIILVDGQQPGPDPVAYATDMIVEAAYATALALPATFIIVNVIKGDAAATSAWRREPSLSMPPSPPPRLAPAYTGLCPGTSRSSLRSFKASRDLSTSLFLSLWAEPRA